MKEGGVGRFFTGWSWRTGRMICAIFVMGQCKDRLAPLFYPHHFKVRVRVRVSLTRVLTLALNLTLTLALTLSHMGPAVLASAGYGFECDMWSLGSVCVNYVCG